LRNQLCLETHKMGFILLGEDETHARADVSTARLTHNADLVWVDAVLGMVLEDVLEHGVGIMNTFGRAPLRSQAIITVEDSDITILANTVHNWLVELCVTGYSTTTMIVNHGRLQPS